MNSTVLPYLLDHFGAGQVSHIVFTQAFSSATSDDIAHFHTDFQALSADEQAALLGAATSCGFTWPAGAIDALTIASDEPQS